MSICEHCKSKHSWGCDDGYAYPTNGCSSFELDWNSLTYKQKQGIMIILQFTENDKEGDDTYVE